MLARYTWYNLEYPFEFYTTPVYHIILYYNDNSDKFEHQHKSISSIHELGIDELSIVKLFYCKQLKCLFIIKDYKQLVISRGQLLLKIIKIRDVHVVDTFNIYQWTH